MELRGIKQCVNWLIDNQGEELICTKDNRVGTSTGYSAVGRKVSFRKNKRNLDIYWINNDSFDCNNKVCYTVFDECVWQPIEDKIWDPDKIKKGDEYHCTIGSLQILCNSYGNLDMDKRVLKQGIAFKEKRYAQEYLEKLIQFNKKYKKDCIIKINI